MFQDSVPGPRALGMSDPPTLSGALALTCIRPRWELLVGAAPAGGRGHPSPFNLTVDACVWGLGTQEQSQKHLPLI